VTPCPVLARQSASLTNAVCVQHRIRAGRAQGGAPLNLNAGHRGIVMLRKALLSVALFSVAAFANASECTLNLNAQAPITVVGSFSNMRYTEEHAYGYIVNLWRSEDCLFGLFLSSYGISGDTPTGLIENLKYDEKTGAISFNARLTMGKVAPDPVKEVYEPATDTYGFTGVMKKKSLRGAVLHELRNFPAAKPLTPENVVLKLSQEESSGLQYLETYSQWEFEAKEILKRRGHKW